MVESSAASHHLLPTVTLAPIPGNDISWGATQPTAGGSYIYASFPPLAFWLATPVARLGAHSLDLLPLSLLNSLFGLGAALMLAALARRLYLDNRAITVGAEDQASLDWLVFLVATVTTLFLCESLQSHGNVYWPQSPAQIVFIVGAWFGYRALKGPASRATTIGLMTCCAVYPMLEWSGYVFNIGIALALAFSVLKQSDTSITQAFSRSARRSALTAVKGPPLQIAGVTMVVGLATILHLVTAVGLEDAIKALLMRAAARSVTLDIAALPFGYWTSLGLLLPFGLIAALIVVRLKHDRSTLPSILLLFVCAFPLLENVVMLQHASQFSFDRLKLAVPLVLALAWVASTASPRRVALGAPVIGAAIIASNLFHYGDRLAAGQPWVEADRANRLSIAPFASMLVDPCVVVGSTSNVRGYLNLLVGRDIYEFVDAQTLSAKARSRGACGAVLIQTTNISPDLPRITAITRISGPGAPPPPRLRPPA
ncbi:hypothetical protein IP78_07955 [Brevundimonas sp. AAP58]|nr:hypothetical protein IP78_07955 [Brevundimonas sp. AAP58]